MLMSYKVGRSGFSQDVLHLSMVAQKLTVSLLFLAISFAPSSVHGTSSILTVCNSIAKQISSSSSVYYPDSPNYGFDISHWSNLSSHSAVCSVEPGSAGDVSHIIKGGGHTTNPGFSSTNGVQVSMTRFSNVVYDASSHTVEIGAGLVWGDVYAALEPHGVNVVGGRVATVGVAGLILGGGMSYNTNQYGLSIDNVVAYELVLPNGKVTTVTSKDKDLFWGLKGGFNNFGVVTKFTMKAYPQTEVWGGTVFVLPDNLDAANDAIAQFSANVTDPKAAIESAFTYYAGQVVLTIIIFYDAPTPPSGLF
ncbi:FAD-binding domain-containing protein [Dentipellis sp. KUC8613]|nr:FAD-binding domain-containing protein [Dentipellis sp. KUC8613]